jgi:hypothetical protein
VRNFLLADDRPWVYFGTVNAMLDCGEVNEWKGRDSPSHSSPSRGAVRIRCNPNNWSLNVSVAGDIVRTEGHGLILAIVRQKV